VVAFDWLGFGFSDKPQPKYGFNYTTAEYAAELGFLEDAIGLKDFTLVVQGFFVPAALQYAKANEARVNQLILINPPVKEQHAKLPSSLAAFSTFLLGDVFAQDPLKASDKPLTECGPYQLDEEDAMVYRRPYLTSGASGFALTAISQALKSELQVGICALLCMWSMLSYLR
jgi:pimeloyl-ACP methyl ester carboxylesterase